MRRLKQFSLLALLLAAPPALATNGMRMIGFSPTQNAMGGASVGAPLDAAVMASNPAGLAETGLRLDVGLTYFDPSVKYSAESPSQQVVINSGVEQESSRGASYIPSIAFSYPLGERVVLGLGLFGVAGMGVDYKDPNLFGGGVKTSYLQARVTPAAGVKLGMGLSVGLTLNLMYGTMEYAVASGAGMVPRKSTSATGYGATFGVLWSPLPLLTVGAAYETKSQFSDFEFDVGAQTLQTQAGPFSTPGGKERLEFDQPPVISIGASVRPLPGFVIAADVERIQWSQTNGKDQPKFTTDQAKTGYLPWNMNWSDQTVFKIGAEFPIFPLLKLRLGYNYGKMPLDPDRAFENIAFPAVSEQHYTGGVQVKVGPVAVHGTVVYSPEVKIAGAGADVGITAYQSKMSQTQIDLGASMSF
jgi:long-chain fatty acid transport protein